MKQALKYLRIKVFYLVLNPFSTRMRAKRMSDFREKMNLTDGNKVLDLGGQPMIWDSIPERLDITIINLPGIAVEQHASHHAITYLEGDACNVTQFRDKDFDIVFSNSVIEHVGNAENRRKFAAEAIRLGKGYWIQTPSPLFPIEAHTGMPFWWLYPDSVRQRIIQSWTKKLPAWTEMVKGTTFVPRKELVKLFPTAQLVTERYLGIPKSNVAYVPSPGIEKNSRSSGKSGPNT